MTTILHPQHVETDMLIVLMSDLTPERLQDYARHTWAENPDTGRRFQTDVQETDDEGKPIFEPPVRVAAADGSDLRETVHVYIHGLDHALPALTRLRPTPDVRAEIFTSRRFSHFYTLDGSHQLVEEDARGYPLHLGETTTASE